MYILRNYNRPEGFDFRERVRHLIGKDEMAEPVFQEYRDAQERMQRYVVGWKIIPFK